MGTFKRKQTENLVCGTLVELKGYVVKAKVRGYRTTKKFKINAYLIAGKLKFDLLTQR